MRVAQIAICSTPWMKDSASYEDVLAKFVELNILQFCDMRNIDNVLKLNTQLKKCSKESREILDKIQSKQMNVI